MHRGELAPVSKLCRRRRQTQNGDVRISPALTGFYSQRALAPATVTFGIATEEMKKLSFSLGPIVVSSKGQTGATEMEQRVDVSAEPFDIGRSRSR